MGRLSRETDPGRCVPRTVGNQQDTGAGSIESTVSEWFIHNVLSEKELLLCPESPGKKLVEFTGNCVRFWRITAIVNVDKATRRILTRLNRYIDSFWPCRRRNELANHEKYDIQFHLMTAWNDRFAEIGHLSLMK